MTEREQMLDDLGSLLRAVGLFDGARPQSPHEVMLEAIREVERIKREADSLAAAAEASLPALSPHARYDERQQRLWNAVAVYRGVGVSCGQGKCQCSYSF